MDAEKKVNTQSIHINFYLGHYYNTKELTN